MSTQETHIAATDGARLAATVTRSPRADHAVVVAGATAVPRRHYAAFAAHHAERGAVVVTFDYRGVAASKDARGVDAPRMHHWGERDLGGVLAWLREHEPDLPVTLFGHSAGGQVAGFAEGAADARAIVGVAAQSGYWRLWPRPDRYVLAGLWYAGIPGITALLGKAPAWSLRGEELPKTIAREWAHWGRHPDYLMRDDTVARRARFARVTAPFLALDFVDDPYAPGASVDALMRFYANAQVERRSVTPQDAGGPVGHFGFFRRTFARTLWQSVDAWLDAKRA